MAGLCADKQYRVHELNRIDNVPLNYEGKTFSGAYLMANGWRFLTHIRWTTTNRTTIQAVCFIWKR